MSDQILSILSVSFDSFVESIGLYGQKKREKKSLKFQTVGLKLKLLTRLILMQLSASVARRQTD